MKGILFTEPNFILTIEGHKTNTRRLVKAPKGLHGIQAVSKNGEILYFRGMDENERPYNDNGDDYLIKPRYNIGEKVYLKEPYINDEDMLFTAFPIRETMCNKGSDILYRYGNDTEILDSIYGDLVKWNNKMFMPGSAARYFIEITDVKCQRLQDISDEDCLREGIMEYWIPKDGVPLESYRYPGCETFYDTPKNTYAAEIDAINGKGTWDSNPFVFSYYYKLV
ncbi:hypothetical protein M2459_001359 [Parabacteroides sp. PF5-5]|uniref:hypothetical protein n=1 Tax=unclassified Parabacteroides TaxID=2649774 RepID=UPI002474203D|nr:MULTISPECIES: hypothetical protein [unclassified Parabacteroides]MDH6304624.1 hypothetical protein [Parabacteroides sp. PH5-39]MDH6315763.1 hypothetical protein [Parabacteroides sp. PF5-13]MDH6319422.1 hypothetical protein [Parabacteroides sp. PH5-13]MDH6323153.1 hypothetical protein [Parabacteroides sp. PH5-8]MDH6326955.1 hypothetical protein [Parabacteroides sp. PH5-41]